MGILLGLVVSVWVLNLVLRAGFTVLALAGGLLGIFGFGALMLGVFSGAFGLFRSVLRGLGRLLLVPFLRIAAVLALLGAVSNVSRHSNAGRRV